MPLSENDTIILYFSCAQIASLAICSYLFFKYGWMGGLLSLLLAFAVYSVIIIIVWKTGLKSSSDSEVIVSTLSDIFVVSAWLVVASVVILIVGIVLGAIENDNLKEKGSSDQKYLISIVVFNLIVVALFYFALYFWTNIVSVVK
jgi:hypothetical protein